MSVRVTNSPPSEIRPIAIPATGAFSGTPALSRLIVLAQTEPMLVEPLEPSASLTWRMAYGNSSRRRQHRQQRPLGQRAVADLAALGRTHPAGLTGRVRREVVVVHVALAVVRVERVDDLLHAQHRQRGDAQDLGLAALEERRTVHPREHVDLGRQRPDVGEPAAVDTHLVADDALAHQGLGQRPVGGADLLLAALEVRRRRARRRARVTRSSSSSRSSLPAICSAAASSVRTAAVTASSTSWP